MSAPALDNIDDLVREVLENPESLTDPEKFSDDQIAAIQKRLNPYGYVGDDSAGKVRAIAASFTNLREDFLAEFSVTAVVGFIFRMLSEWEVPAEVRRWTPAAKKGKTPKAPFTADELLTRAGALLKLAQLAKDAEVEYNKIAEEKRAFEAAGGATNDNATTSATADDATTTSAITDDATTTSTTTGSATTGSATTESAPARRDFEAELRKAETKAIGLGFVASYELMTQGTEADERMDATYEVARRNPEVRKTIEEQKLAPHRGGKLEVPPAVAKGIIDDFLRAWFEFDPDSHVRGSFERFRSGKDAPAAPDGAPSHLAALRAVPSVPEADREAVRELTADPRGFNAAAYLLRSQAERPAYADAVRSALEAPERFRGYLERIPPGDAARAAIETNVPRDTFFRLRYYTDANFEKLRLANLAIHGRDPDLEEAVLVYEVFEGTEESVQAAFEKWYSAHQDEIVSDAKLVQVGAWTFLGSFEKNRDKIDFFNKHTAVLKEIIDRHRDDRALGKSLMEKRVKKAVAKNIREDGPHAPGLAASTKDATKALDAAGASAVLSAEERRRLERARGDLQAAGDLAALERCRGIIRTLTEAKKVRALLPEEERELKDAQKDLAVAEQMLEVPAGAIQVDVFQHDARSGELKKSHFYTEAAAPEPVVAGGPPDGPPAPVATRQANVARPAPTPKAVADATASAK